MRNTLTTMALAAALLCACCGKSHKQKTADALNLADSLRMADSLAKASNNAERMTVRRFDPDKLPYGEVVGGTSTENGATGELTILGADGKLYCAIVPRYYWDYVNKGDRVGDPDYRPDAAEDSPTVRDSVEGEEEP